jgi:urease accessory protein
MADNTRTVISEQSYRKLFNTGDDFSQQNMKIQVGENASLYYVPYPVIPFEGSRFRSRTEINLRSSSKIIYGEILACGREGMGEKFAFAEFSSRTCVSVDGKPVFLDNSRLIGGEADFSGIGFFENYSCQGVFFLFGFDSKLESFTFPADDESQAAISKSSAGYTIRALGTGANSLYKFMEKCLKIFIFNIF